MLYNAVLQHCKKMHEIFSLKQNPIELLSFQLKTPVFLEITIIHGLACRGK